MWRRIHLHAVARQGRIRRSFMMEGTRGWEIRVRTWRGVGRLESNRGLPIVDGRSSKHALSWQTPSWSWRTGCAPGDGLCASDGRGADYHQHPACHRLSIEGGRQKAGGEKKTATYRKSTEEEGDDPPLLYHSPHRQRVLSSLPTSSWYPSGLNCPPTLPGEAPRTPIGKPKLDQRCH